jgi:CBS domain containing-hemolysin-like protein
MDSAAWGEVALLVACVLVAGLASATETAMTSVGRLRVRYLAEEGSRAAAILQQLHRDPSRFLSTVLVVNTFALILASFATTLLSVRFLPPAVGFWGDLAVSLVLSIFLLIFAEVTPKTLAIRQSERLALAAAPVVNQLATILRPVIWFITLIARAITGGRAARSPYLTEQELMTLLHVSEEQGVIEEKEGEMISGIIEIGDKAVREVMVPRTDITAVERTASLDELVRLFEEYRHTRLPVYEEDLDHIVGMVNIKDLVVVLDRDREAFDMDSVMRPILFTPESKKVDELLHQMQREKVHMMIVVDEYGGTAGLVTLEDVLEEIVGEIRDEYDVGEEEPLQILDAHIASVDARYPMAELNEALQLGVEESSDYDSVGGYVYATLGDIPAAGATFQVGKVSWTVEKVNGNRVVRVALRSQEPWPAEVLQEHGLEAPVQSQRPSTGAGEVGREGYLPH